MKILLKGVGALAGLAITLAVVLMIVGSTRLGAPLSVPEHSAPTPIADSASLDEGARLADVFACTECHGQRLEGTNFLDGGPFMKLPAPNLTGGRFNAGELELAIRHGVGADGRTLLIMPVEAFAPMSDNDLARVTGYIASLRAMESDLIERSVGPIGRAVASFQASALQPARGIAQVAEHPKASGEVGAYYSSMCAACHGADLGGAMFSGEAPIWAPNLSSHATGLAAWSEAAFATALRQGQRPDGRALDAAAMPWRGFSKLRDYEVTALWEHLRRLPPVDRAPPT